MFRPQGTPYWPSLLTCSDQKAGDREAVEAVLQEHMSFRRRKSMILDPMKGACEEQRIRQWESLHVKDGGGGQKLDVHSCGGQGEGWGGGERVRSWHMWRAGKKYARKQKETLLISFWNCLFLLVMSWKFKFDWTFSFLDYIFAIRVKLIPADHEATVQSLISSWLIGLIWILQITRLLSSTSDQHENCG